MCGVKVTDRVSFSELRVRLGTDDIKKERRKKKKKKKETG